MKDARRVMPNRKTVNAREDFSLCRWKRGNDIFPILFDPANCTSIFPLIMEKTFCLDAKL